MFQQGPFNDHVAMGAHLLGSRAAATVRYISPEFSLARLNPRRCNACTCTSVVVNTMAAQPGLKSGTRERIAASSAE